MRCNVYSQELTSEVKLVSKEGTDGSGDISTFYGVRMYLHSPKQLHQNTDDDDRSAITLWLPSSKERRTELGETLTEMAYLVTEAPE